MHIMNLEEIQGIRLRIPELIQHFEDRDVKFASLTKEWLVKAEKVLTNNRIAAAADIAVLRGVLISAERGAIPSGIVFSGRMTVRKIRDGISADVLRKADETISAAIRAPEAQIAEGERLTRQVVALAIRKGLIQQGTPSGHDEMLKEIWRRMSLDPELGPVTTHIIGLVGAYDALILLDRSLPVLE
jgi:hypothetical protein